MNLNFRKRDIIYIIIIILLAIGLAFFAKQPKKKEIVKVPYKIEVPVPGKQGISDTVYLPKPYPVEKENPVNDSLKKAYIKSQDSIAKLNMFIAAITERKYEEEYIDSTQSVTVYSRVQGRLLEQSIMYNIYPSIIEHEGEAEVELPKYNEVYWKLNAGNNFNEGFKLKPLFSGEIILKNKKDELFSIEVNTRGDALLGYGKKF